MSGSTPLTKSARQQQIVRVDRDDTYIAKLSSAVDAFNEELDNLVNSIRGVDQFRRVA